MKLANPLNYPLAVLAGGIVLVVGVRLANLSSVVMLPFAAVIATFNGYGRGQINEVIRHLSFVICHRNHNVPFQQAVIKNRGTL
jgi:hypothetical protein